MPICLGTHPPPLTVAVTLDLSVLEQMEIMCHVISQEFEFSAELTPGSISIVHIAAPIGAKTDKKNCSPSISRTSCQYLNGHWRRKCLCIISCIILSPSQSCVTSYLEPITRCLPSAPLRLHAFRIAPLI